MKSRELWVRIYDIRWIRHATVPIDNAGGKMLVRSTTLNSPFTICYIRTKDLLIPAVVVCAVYGVRRTEYKYEYVLVFDTTDKIA